MKVLFDIPDKAVDLVLMATLLHADEEDTKKTKGYFEKNKDSVIELTPEDIGEKGMELAIGMAAIIVGIKAKEIGL